jgi:hypothetical protein
MTCRGVDVRSIAWQISPVKLIFLIQFALYSELIKFKKQLETNFFVSDTKLLYYISLLI